MRFVSTIAAAGFATLLTAGSGVAFAGTTIDSALDTGGAPVLELARDGCGFGAHRGW